MAIDMPFVTKKMIAMFALQKCESRLVYCPRYIIKIKFTCLRHTIEHADVIFQFIHFKNA